VECGERRGLANMSRGARSARIEDATATLVEMGLLA
jgi:hypothetical protein